MARAGRLALAAGIALACCIASAAPLDVLDACAGNTSAEGAGIVRLEGHCPGLESALRETGLIDQLPGNWRQTLTRDAVHDLAELSHRYVAAPPAVPDSRGMDAIVRQLAREQPRPVRSWRDAVWEWLRSWSSAPGSDSAGWFERLLDRLTRSAGLIEVIAYGLLALTVCAAMAFVFNELKLAGVLGRRRDDSRPRVAIGEPKASGAPDIDDLDCAAPTERPAILLRLLVTRLLSRGQLGSERSLTHRELVAHSVFTEPDSRVRFAHVAQLAERVLYGSDHANTEHAAAVIAEGRILLQQLQASGVQQP